jgi:hypothetical protein
MENGFETQALDSMKTINVLIIILIVVLLLPVLRKLYVLIRNCCTKKPAQTLSNMDFNEADRLLQQHQISLTRLSDSNPLQPSAVANSTEQDKLIEPFPVDDHSFKTRRVIQQAVSNVVGSVMSAATTDESFGNENRKTAQMRGVVLGKRD